MSEGKGESLFGRQYLGYLWHVVFYVACSEGDKNVEVCLASHIEYVSLCDEVSLHSRAQVVVDESACHAWYGEFASWIDVAEVDSVEAREGIGKLAVEVACASVEMRLEDGSYLLVGIHLSD